jgi:UDP-N-acetylglucosamine 3-dehydrogenase
MINIAIIGLGIMGKNHYRILKNFDNVNIVAVCDQNIQEKYEEPTFSNVDELLSKVQNIDGIIIAVPTFLHKDIAIKCLEKKINLLIEKPVADTIDNALSILEMAQKSDVKVVVGHIERCNPVVETMKRELKDKEIFCISFTRTSPFPTRISDVGVLTDLSVHDIDLLRYLTEKNITSSHIIKSNKIAKKNEDNVVISLMLENNICSTITTNWLTPFKKRIIEVACRDSYYVADLISQDLTQYIHNKELNNSYITRNCFIRKGDALEKELQEFIQYISNDNHKTFLANIKDSIETLQLINV